MSTQPTAVWRKAYPYLLQNSILSFLRCRFSNKLHCIHLLIIYPLVLIFHIYIFFLLLCQVLITENPKSFSHFLTNVCAIIGGVFTVGILLSLSLSLYIYIYIYIFFFFSTFKILLLAIVNYCSFACFRLLEFWIPFCTTLLD